jgi:hypothetical protein
MNILIHSCIYMHQDRSTAPRDKNPSMSADPQLLPSLFMRAVMDETKHYKFPAADDDGPPPPDEHNCLTTAYFSFCLAWVVILLVIIFAQAYDNAVTPEPRLFIRLVAAEGVGVDDDPWKPPVFELAVDVDAIPEPSLFTIDGEGTTRRYGSRTAA